MWAEVSLQGHRSLQRANSDNLIPCMSSRRPPLFFFLRVCETGWGRGGQAETQARVLGLGSRPRPAMGAASDVTGGGPDKGRHRQGAGPAVEGRGAGASGSAGRRSRGVAGSC